MIAVAVQTKTLVGIIKKYERYTSEIFMYRVFLENYHQPHETVDGVPIFNFEYNGIVYEIGSRVICIAKDNEMSQVYVLGQIYDPNISRNSIPAKPGETQMNSASDAKSGIGPLGLNDNFVAFGGKGVLKINSQTFSLNVNNSVLLEGSQGGLKLISDLNNSQGINIKDGHTSIISDDGFKLSSAKGDIELYGNGFKFFNSTSADPFIYFSKAALRFITNEFYSISGTYAFTGGSGSFKGKGTTVDWNVLKGSYDIRLGTGDFRINLLNVSGAEVYFKIGIGPLYLSQFIFDQNSLEVKIGAALPDSLKLGGGEIKIKVGNIPGLQSELLIDGDVGSLKINGIVGSSSYEYKSSSITLKNTGTSGSATLEIASGKLTLTSASKATGGKIVLDGEVEITGKLTVKGDDGLEVTKDVVVKGSKGVEASSGDVKAGTVSLKLHKHASSIPGGPAPPLPG